MTDLLTENARLRAALRYMVNHAKWSEENEGVYWEATKIAQAALATPAPDAVQEAARVLLADGVAMQTLVDFQLRHSATASTKARSMRHVQMKAALRAIAGDRT